VNDTFFLQYQIEYQLAKAHTDALLQEADNVRLSRLAGNVGSKSSARGPQFVRLLRQLARRPAFV
jgi:hypothetical protein